MMYKSFDKKSYDRWHDDENCQDDYKLYGENIAKVNYKVIELLEDVEEARFFY